MAWIQSPRLGKLLFSTLSLCAYHSAFADCNNDARKRIHDEEACYASKNCQAAENFCRTVTFAPNRNTAVSYRQSADSRSPARGHLHSSRLAPPVCSPTPAACGWFHPGEVLYLKKSFPSFYDVVTKNSPKSHANNDLCLKGMLCISGQANLDYRFYNRNGQTALPGSTFGVGVRPLFRDVNGLENRDHTGSINNFDVFMDVAINQWVSAHVDLAYVNASMKCKTFANFEVDWDSVYRSSAALKVNQAYFMLTNPALTPLYIQIGRFSVNFGDYEPFPMTESFTQLLSEMRSGGVIVGAVFDNGFYASANYSMAHLSYGPKEFVYRTGLGDWDKNKDKNYGALVGFKACFDDECQDRHLSVDTNLSYIDNIRDSMYLTEAFNYFNGPDFSATAPILGQLAEKVAFLMQRAAGLSAHAQLNYNQFALSADYVTALRRLNPKSDESQISAWGVNGTVHFPIFCHHTKLELGFQKARNSKVFYSESVPFQGQTNVYLPNLFNPGHLLPDYRVAGSYSVDLMHHITGSVQAVVDRDLCKKDGGTGLSSYLLLARLGFEF